MASKKSKANKVKYQIEDKVVVKTKSWTGEVRTRVAMVTNIRPAGKMAKRSYDVRTEDGSGLIMIGVDEPKSTQTIVSDITKVWQEEGSGTNMYIHKKHGHTRANFADGTKLRADGDGEGIMLVGQYEKYNDFHFPCQGPRSY